MQYFLDIMVAKIYVEGNDEPELKNAIKSIEAWRAFELELVTIRRLFLKNIIHIAIQVPVKAWVPFNSGQFLIGMVDMMLYEHSSYWLYCSAC